MIMTLVCILFALFGYAMCDIFKACEECKHKQRVERHKRKREKFHNELEEYLKARDERLGKRK